MLGRFELKKSTHVRQTLGLKVSLESSQLCQTSLQYRQLLVQTLALTSGHQALTSYRMHLFIRKIADALWSQEPRDFLDQAYLDGQGTNIINHCLQCDLRLIS
jgi:hypothetical protein